MSNARTYQPNYLDKNEMNKMNNEDSMLFSPEIPVALPDGLIRTIDLNADIAVNFRIWPYSSQGEDYTLMLNGMPVGERKVITESEAGSDAMLTLTLPSTALTKDGPHSVGYMIIATPGGGTTLSPTAVIRVDRTAPAGPLLGPALFPNMDPTNLRGKIPAYVGMEVGDTVQTLCNDIQGPSYVIVAENLTTLPVEITFTREFLDSLQSDKVNITYHVTDRAGNQSVLAQPVELTLHP